MGNIFSASEVVELGIQIEKNGRDFYNEMAQKTLDDEAKEVFSYLAGEEQKHIAAFQALFDSVSKYEPKEAYPEEYFSYMNSLASQYIFTQKDKGAEIAKAVKSDVEGINLGIKAEEDSITFYEGMKKVVPEEDKKLIDEMISQEKDHWKQLSDLKKVLKS